MGRMPPGDHRLQRPPDRPDRLLVASPSSRETTGRARVSEPVGSGCAPHVQGSSCVTPICPPTDPARVRRRSRASDAAIRRPADSPACSWSWTRSPSPPRNCSPPPLSRVQVVPMSTTTAPSRASGTRSTTPWVAAGGGAVPHQAILRELPPEPLAAALGTAEQPTPMLPPTEVPAPDAAWYSALSPCGVIETSAGYVPSSTMVTGPATTIRQLPSRHACTSEPSAATSARPAAEDGAAEPLGTDDRRFGDDSDESQAVRVIAHVATTVPVTATQRMAAKPGVDDAARRRVRRIRPRSTAKTPMAAPCGSSPPFRRAGHRPPVVTCGNCSGSVAGALVCRSWGRFGPVGRTTRNRAPPPDASSTITLPWWAATSRRTMARPGPTPPESRSRLGSRRTNRSKMWSRWARGPGPSSATRSTAVCPSADGATVGRTADEVVGRGVVGGVARDPGELPGVAVHPGRGARRVAPTTASGPRPRCARVHPDRGRDARAGRAPGRDRRCGQAREGRADDHCGDRRPRHGEHRHAAVVGQPPCRAEAPAEAEGRGPVRATSRSRGCVRPRTARACSPRPGPRSRWSGTAVRTPGPPSCPARPCGSAGSRPGFAPPRSARPRSPPSPPCAARSHPSRAPRPGGSSGFTSPPVPAGRSVRRPPTRNMRVAPPTAPTTSGSPTARPRRRA
ncbi:hypothetical protein EHYA_05514 [Embleya hyalina]|uniref:Uncharacterized protein n=1 Tax=Embleya hyalina TaxID=516124 RepID=A0A401YT64_9ACTN|nr:hypothetical protein EHYA_05514 [Embleya hyalina]